MRAFCLTGNDGQIKDRDMLDLYEGYLALGYEVKMFKEIDLVINPKLITKDDIFCGHVSICIRILKNNRIPIPVSYDYPKELKSYLGRNISRMTLMQFHNSLIEDELEVFVKPVKNKLFTGFVGYFPKDLDKITCNMETEIYVSEVVKFDAEFRVYIYQNKIVGSYRYWGDNWKVYINTDEVEKMLALLINMPIFYSIDVGVDDKGKTLLVEVNDGYALGNYGLSPNEYARMSAARWQEICSVL